MKITKVLLISAIGGLLFLTSYAVTIETQSIMNESKMTGVSSKMIESESFEWSEFYKQMRDINNKHISIDRASLITDLRESLAQEDEREEFVVFSNSKEQFQEILDNFNPTIVYYNLRAAVVEITQTEYELFNNLYFSNVFPRVEFYQADYIDKIEVESSSIGLSAVEDAEIMNLKQLWDAGYSGQGTLVGIFDNGVQDNHHALSHAHRESKDFSIGGAYVSRTHGTPVAGTIVSNGGTGNATGAVGNAYSAEYISAEMGQAENGLLVFDMVGGFDWMLSFDDLNVINLSWGALGGADIYDPIFQRYMEENVVIVVSAGNQGHGISHRVGSPSTSLYSISVGSIDHNLEISTFSSGGPGGIGLAKPDVVAPGGDINTTQVGNTYGTSSGTSFSSPLTAGAIATIISALEAEGINWTVASIKAALRRTATSLGYNEYIQGAGLVNANAAFNYLKNLAKDGNNVPKAFDVAPRSGLHPLLSKIPQNVIADAHLTLITSHHNELVIELSSNLQSFTSVSFRDNYDTTLLQLEFDTVNNNVSLGSINGHVKVSLAGSTIEVPINIEIIPEPVGRVYVDQYYTPYSGANMLWRAGRYINQFVYEMNQAGYWSEFVNLPFNSSNTILQNFDVLLMMYPFELGDRLSPFTNAMEFSTEEANFLRDYIDSGKSAFIGFSPTFERVSEYNPNPTGGNPAGISSMLGQFGVIANTYGTLYDYIIDVYTRSFPSSTARVNNQTIVTKGLSDFKVSNFGFNVSNQATPLISSSVSTVMAKYSSSEGGRLLMSTITSFMQYHVYNDPENVDSRQLLHNVIEYLTSQNKLDIITDESDGNRMYLTIKNWIDGEVQTSLPPIQLKYSSDTKESLMLIDNPLYNISMNSDNSFLFTFNYSEDGIYELYLDNGIEYARKFIILDRQGPIITYLEEKTPIFKVTDNTAEFVFRITDSLNTVLASSISVRINEEQSGFVALWNGLNNRLTIKISDIDALVDRKDYSHIIQINATDSIGNLNSLDFFFYTEIPKDISEKVSTTSEITTKSDDSDANGISYPTFGIFTFLLFTYGKTMIRRRKL
jgi:subtilisin family serine protease